VLYTEPSPSDYEQIIDLRKEEAKWNQLLR
jgi:hypothetical protein